MEFKKLLRQWSDGARSNEFSGGSYISIGFIKEKKPEISNPYAKNYYLSNSWQVGSVDLADGSKLTDVLLKYDVVKHIVEIKKEDDVYLVSAKSVNDFR